MPHPFALYIFSTSQSQINESSSSPPLPYSFLPPSLPLRTYASPLVLHSTNSGGVAINDVVLHGIVPYAPFGGVGDPATANTMGSSASWSFHITDMSLMHRCGWIGLWDLGICRIVWKLWIKSRSRILLDPSSARLMRIRELEGSCWVFPVGRNRER